MKKDTLQIRQFLHANYIFTSIVPFLFPFYIWEKGEKCLTTTNFLLRMDFPPPRPSLQPHPPGATKRHSLSTEWRSSVLLSDLKIRV